MEPAGDQVMFGKKISLRRWLDTIIKRHTEKADDHKPQMFIPAKQKEEA